MSTIDIPNDGSDIQTDPDTSIESLIFGKYVLDIANPLCKMMEEIDRYWDQRNTFCNNRTINSLNFSTNNYRVELSFKKIIDEK